MQDAITGGGFLSGFSVQGPNLGRVNISHLLFADDTLLLYESDHGHIQFQYLKAPCFVLRLLELKVNNLLKSKKAPVGPMSNI